MGRYSGHEQLANAARPSSRPAAAEETARQRQQHIYVLRRARVFAHPELQGQATFEQPIVRVGLCQAGKKAVEDDELAQAHQWDAGLGAFSNQARFEGAAKGGRSLVGHG